MRACILVLLLSLTATATARADDVAAYEVEADADAAGADPRVAALDDAFARAVTQAVGELVDAEARRAQRSALTQHVIGRARLWVTKFTVTRDDNRDGRRQLAVTVRIDRDKLRAKLVELGIALAADAGPAGAPAPGPGAKQAVVLLRISHPGDPAGAARATYGASADRELPGLGALSASLRAGNLNVVRAPAAGPAARAEGELPLDDDAAESLAAEARAEVAAVAGVSIGAPVAVRGLPITAVAVTARVRLVGRGRQVLGEGSALVAARGSERGAIDAAVEQAVVAAAADVMPRPTQALATATEFRDGEAPLGEPGVVLVRIAAKTPWGMVAAAQKHLAGARGVQRAVLRRVSPAGWVIGVTTTESIDRIAQIARKPPTAELTAKVRVANDVVELALGGTP